MGFDGVAQGQIERHAVLVSAPLTLAGQYPGEFEIKDDFLDCPLGDTDPVGDIAEACGGVLQQADEHVGVIGEEGPAGLRGAGRGLWSRGG